VNEILDGFVQAVHLILILDPEVMEITVRTLEISLVSTAIATLISVPVGGLIHFREFRGKRVLVNVIQTLYALPTVIVGLLVFLLISRAGPFGFMRLLFSPAGMIIAQVILILPIMIGLTLSALSGVDRSKRDTIVALGASESQAILTMLREVRFAIMGAVVLGFGRAISEVGAAMMIGGNIRGFTRVLTTAIALETSMGNVSLSLALGMILLAIALIVNVLLNLFQQERIVYD
jgi:tungstate transport system permease protein